MEIKKTSITFEIFLCKRANFLIINNFVWNIKWWTLTLKFIDKFCNEVTWLQFIQVLNSWKYNIHFHIFVYFWMKTEIFKKILTFLYIFCQEITDYIGFLESKLFKKELYKFMNFKDIGINKQRHM